MEDTFVKRQDVVDLLWRFLESQKRLPHTCKSKRFEEGAIEVSANLAAVRDTADKIMQVFGIDPSEIPVEPDCDED